MSSAATGYREYMVLVDSPELAGFVDSCVVTGNVVAVAVVDWFGFASEG